MGEAKVIDINAKEKAVKQVSSHTQGGFTFKAGHYFAIIDDKPYRFYHIKSIQEGGRMVFDVYRVIDNKAHLFDVGVGFHAITFNYRIGIKNVELSAQPFYPVGEPKIYKTGAQEYKNVEKVQKNKKPVTPVNKGNTPQQGSLF